MEQLGLEHTEREELQLPPGLPKEGDILRLPPFVCTDSGCLNFPKLVHPSL